MKAKLIKTPEQLYKLKFYNDEDMLACATALLSKQNCDEIFGVTDVEKLANEAFPDESEPGWRDSFSPRERKGFKSGYNKAMELNKDKVFTLSNLRKAFNSLENHPNRTFTELVALLQPTEIDVEIEMKKVVDKTKVIGAVKGVKGSGDKITTYKSVPKLDSEGCLILKKI